MPCAMVDQLACLEGPILGKDGVLTMSRGIAQVPFVRRSHCPGAPRLCSNWTRTGLLLAAVAGCLAFCPAWAQPGQPGTAAETTRDRVLSNSGFQGGLVVQAGCRDAALAVSLAEAGNVRVHGLVADRDRLDEVRRQIRDAGLYGQVSAMGWDGPFLPYADGMVNLLLVLGGRVELKPEEIDRVLAPLGVALIEREGKLTSHRKPWPADVDQWTHSRYDATGNAVSRDERAGPPRFLQWEALPRWNRGVKTSGLVSTKGRIFYVLDDSHFAARARTWSLIARDASNGIQLWRHELPSWRGSRGGKKVGPAQVNRRLVADKDRVYATLGEFAPVSELDAATGEVVRTFDTTARTEEFLLSGGTLVALVNPNAVAAVRRGYGKSMVLTAVSLDSGKPRWAREVRVILPMTLAADQERVVYHDGRAIQCVDLEKGDPLWTSPPTGQKIVHRGQSNPDSPGAEKSTIVLAPQFAPTLIIYDEVVAFAGGRQLNVVSADDGKELWRSDFAPSNYSVPVDLFGFEGCLWGPDVRMNLWRPMDDDLGVKAYDPLTGIITVSYTHLTLPTNRVAGRSRWSPCH